MFIRREGGARGAALEWRIRLLVGGAVLALVGMWTNQGWLINVAIAVLVVGFLLRFAGRSGKGADDPDRPD